MSAQYGTRKQTIYFSTSPQNEENSQSRKDMADRIQIDKINKDSMKNVNLLKD